WVVEKVDGDSLESLVERADALLYDAKNLGRNRVMPI
ncbi:GGDEF domain-containing protein, partial [Vibrio metoecus]